MTNRFNDKGIFAEFKLLIILWLIAVIGGATFTLATIDFFIVGATMFASPGTMMLVGAATFLVFAGAGAWFVFSKMEDF